MNEIQTIEIKQIELEINFYKEQTARNIIEIGKRLIQAKEMLPHGEWGAWLEEKIEFSQQTANKYMRVANEMGDYASMRNIGTAKLFSLLSLPAEEREAFIEENPVEDMTTRELKQAIKEKKELEKQIEELEGVNQRIKTDFSIEKNSLSIKVDSLNQDKNFLQNELNKLKNRPVEVIEKVVEIIPDDYDKLKRDLKDSNFELEQLKNQQALLERKAKLNDDEAKKYKQLKDQIENLSKQKDDLGRQIKARTELSGLVVRIEHILKTELAPIKYSRAIDEASTDEIVVNNLRDIVGRVQDWCNEIYKYIPKKNYSDVIEMEVIEYEQ